jgi:CheY-like chemotaxis protein
MDIGLPGMSGNEATACLKTDPATRNIPVVVQTAWNDGIHTNRALEAGAAEILHKPMDVKVLLDVLRKYLSAGNETTRDAAA